jgi:hypothetical protein
MADFLDAADSPVSGRQRADELAEDMLLTINDKVNFTTAPSARCAYHAFGNIIDMAPASPILSTIDPNELGLTRGFDQLW